MLRRPHRFVIPAAAFLAILPLLLHGPTCGHDFDFHLLSWLEAATQYTHGQYPHWAFTPAYNGGEPRFLFYPPISWTLGALLTLLLPIRYAGTAFTFLALTLSGFTAHRLASELSSPHKESSPSFWRGQSLRFGSDPPQTLLKTADPGAPRPASETWAGGGNKPLLCALLYLANPYMLFTAYERSAFAELLAAAWLPLLFQSSLLPNPNPRRQILATALPLALLWLTNAPAAVMGTYALALLTLIRLAFAFLAQGRPALSLPHAASHCFSLPFTIATTLSGTALGLALSAFYLVPAAFQRRFVQISMAINEGMRPQDHFLFHHMLPLTPDNEFHDAVVRTASIIALLLLAAIATTLVLFFHQLTKIAILSEAKNLPVDRTTPSPQPTSQILLTLLIAFLLTPISLPIWNHTPQLLFLQFPWRLTALLAVILLTLLAQTLKQSRRPALLTATLPFLLILPAYHLFHQPCDATDAPIARAALFHSSRGTEPTDEYTPLTADNDALHPGDPSWWSTCLTPGTDLNLPPTGHQPPGQAPPHLTLDLPCPSLLILNRRLYPSWQITDNGHPIQPPAEIRDDGLITLNLPPGPNTIDLTWRNTPDQTAGLLLSTLAILVALALTRQGPGPIGKHPARTGVRPARNPYPLHSKR